MGGRDGCRTGYPAVTTAAGHRVWVSSPRAPTRELRWGSSGAVLLGTATATAASAARPGRTSPCPGIPARAHRRRRARACRTSAGAPDDGRRPRRLPRRGQRRGAGRPAPRRPRRRARVVATFDVDAVPRLPRPPARRCRSSATTTRTTTPRGWWSGCCATAGGTPYLLLQRPRARQPLGGLRPRGPRGRRALRRHPRGRAWARCRWRCRTPGRSRSPTTPTTPTLLTGESPWRGELRVPSSAQALLEVRLGEWGHDAMGFVAHIPHYLAQLDYPQASRGAARAGRERPAGSPSTSPACWPRPRSARPRSPATSPPTTRSATSSPALEQQYDAFERAEESGSQPAGRGRSRCPRARRSASSSSSSWPASTARPDADRRRPARTDRGCPVPVRRRARRPARPRGPRRQPVPRAASPTPSCQRVFGGQVAAQALIAGARTVDRGVRRALAALLLPAARRHRGADHLRRGAAPRRPLVRHPPGGGAPARPADLLPDRQLPDARGGLRAPGRDARRDRRPRRGIDLGELVPRPRGAGGRPSSGSGSGRRSTSATSATPRQGLPEDPDAAGAGAAVDPGRRRPRRRPAAAPRGVHLRQRHDPARRRRWCRTACTSASRGMQVASLDHTIWFHRPFRADEWWLYDQEIAVGLRRPRAGPGPGVHRRTATLVATVAQEGLIRSATSPLARSVQVATRRNSHVPTVARDARRAARPRGPRRRPLPRPAGRHQPRSASTASPVAAQALIAGGAHRRRPGTPRTRCTPYFLLPGDTPVPIVYDVERIRDGRSFATRRVVARQHGRPIYYLTASFQRPEEGFDHQDVMPDVPAPEQAGRHDRPDAAPAATPRRPTPWPGSGRRSRRATLGDLRGTGCRRGPGPPGPRARLWIRVDGQLPDDPVDAPRRPSPTPAT